jgi:hypothetical protein
LSDFPTQNLTGHTVSTRSCATNGITTDDQAFELVPQTFQIRHIATKLCVTASSGKVGAALTLQTCNFTAPLQAWFNDYSNIHHGDCSMTLQRYNLSLGASMDGEVATVTPGTFNRTTWGKWTYVGHFNQIAPISPFVFPTWGLYHNARCEGRRCDMKLPTRW